MSGSLLSIQLSLNGDGTLGINQELSFPVRTPVYGERNLGFTALVGITRLERFQTLAYLGIFVHGHFNVGPLELRLVVVDVTKLDDNPRVSDVILVVVVILTLWRREHCLF